MSEPARPRFYVIATSGYPEGPGWHAPSTSYAVLDRLWAFREVFYAPPSSVPDAVRRARAEAHAERANARHEQHMREVA